MATLMDCVHAVQAGASIIFCPETLVRGSEKTLLADVLPKVENEDVLLDMSAVQTMDAAGIGTLVTLRQIAERGGRSLYLINPSPRAAQILELVGLDTVLFFDRA